MLELDLILPFVSRLNALGAPYMITGSMAGVIYGEPRLTHDVDIVLALDPSLASRLESAFPADLFYCPPADVIVIEAKRGQRGHFNLIHYETGFKADIYVAHDELHRWALGARRSIAAGPLRIPVAPPEYVILRKLEYYREGRSEKHLIDIRSMLHVSRGDIDLALIDDQAALLGLTSVWASVKPGLTA